MRHDVYYCLLFQSFSRVLDVLKMIFDESRCLAGHPKRLYGQTRSNWLSQKDEAGNSGHPQVPGKSCNLEFDVFFFMFLPCLQIRHYVLSLGLSFS